MFWRISNQTFGLLRLDHNSVSAWLHSCPFALHTHQLLNACNVPPCFIRQVILKSALANVTFPAWNMLVYHLSCFRDAHVWWQYLVIHLVFDVRDLTALRAARQSLLG